jgi:hypothetical protein
MTILQILGRKRGSSESDSTKVSKAVSLNLRRSIESLDGVGKENFQELHEAALRCVAAGGNLHVLSVALLKVKGMSRNRANEIARSLHRKAKSQITREKQSALGVTHAVWMYANAPCMTDPRNPTVEDLERDASHSAANGTKYEISKGLSLNDVCTWPGIEDGCKCSSRSVIPGLEKL